MGGHNLALVLDMNCSNLKLSLTSPLFLGLWLEMLMIPIDPFGRRV